MTSQLAEKASEKSLNSQQDNRHSSDSSARGRQSDVGLSSNSAKANWTGVLLGATLVLPMVAAYVIFKTGIGLPRGTVNHGDLLKPVKAIGELNFIDEAGNPVDLLDGDKKWKILIPAGADCDQVCRQNLYLTRQVHIGLGEKAHRVERIYINGDTGLDPSLKSFLQREHPKLKRVRVAPEKWRQWLASTNAAPPSTQRDSLNTHNYFLVDQEGFAMMFYSPAHKGKDLLQDLKRLLKYSYEE